MQYHEIGFRIACSQGDRLGRLGLGRWVFQIRHVISPLAVSENGGFDQQFIALKNRENNDNPLDLLGYTICRETPNYHIIPIIATILSGYCKQYSDWMIYPNHPNVNPSCW